ncbi:MAG: ATP-binding cassette domain-containing protein, partial [Fidelibacterota bacterium]
MTKPFSFTLRFPKFSDEPIHVEYEPGLHVIYGEAGVGKSALGNCLAGHPCDAVTNFILADYHPPKECFFVPQNPENLFVTSTVEDELAFSIECRKGTREELLTAYRQLNQVIPESVNRKNHPVDLSGGEKEIINLALALSSPRKVLIIDDGLSFLNEDVKQTWVRKMIDWSRKNKAVVLWLTSEWDDLIWGTTGRELSLSAFQPVQDLFIRHYPRLSRDSGNMSITIRQLSYRYDRRPPLFEGFNYRCRQVRQLGILGPNGSGKTTLALLAMGILRPESGAVSVELESYCKPCYLDQFPERMLGTNSVEAWVEELMGANLLSAANLRIVQSVLDQFQISWNQARNKRALDLSWSMLRTIAIVILSYSDFDPLIL